MNIILLAGIILFLFYDHYIPKRDKLIMFGCIILAIILNLNDILDDYLDLPKYQHMIPLRLFSSWIGYVCRPVLLWGLWEILQGNKQKRIRSLFAILTIGNTLIYSSVIFCDLTYGYDPVTYRWYRGPLCYTAHMVMVLMVLLFLPVLTESYIHNRRRELLAGILSLAIVVTATYYDTFHNHNTITDVITLEIILHFLFLHIGLEQEYTKTIMQMQRAQIMQMQINPHFINNTLGTIQALCDIDPQLAAKTTGNFARYLRTNLLVIDKPLPVPLEEELEHTKTYLEIEKLRFPWIHVEYDIQDTDFCVPALSIQPLVENAVQHGLRKKKQGTLTIRTKQTQNGHRIQISDNGTGFDPNNPITKNGHGVGINNVKYRIEQISHGTLTIKSRIEKGTTVTILIP